MGFYRVTFTLPIKSIFFICIFLLFLYFCVDPNWLVTIVFYLFLLLFFFSYEEELIFMWFLNFRLGRLHIQFIFDSILRKSSLLFSVFIKKYIYTKIWTIVRASDSRTNQTKLPKKISKSDLVTWRWRLG